MTAPALELSGIEMHYGYVKALTGVNLSVQPGEIVGLLGDNGAGKSTLLKVMSGAHRPSVGTVRVHGNEVHFHAPKDAAAAGVQMVYQDLALLDAQDIATNLKLGSEPLRRFPLNLLGLVDRKAMRLESERELDRLGVRTAPMSRQVEMLSGGQRQVLAIARSAVRVTDGSGIMLLDEPTAALGHEQTKLVEGLILTMAARGIAIVLVTHNLPLCFKVADRIAVLNRGRKVADIPAGETNNDAVVGWITGARQAQEHLR
jgi:simple sugar transport system ATP-binding protein